MVDKPVKRNLKSQSVMRLLFMILILVLINIAGGFVFYRLDLTSEKRYTLSPASRELATNLKDVVYVKVYLEGEFPAGFKRLRNETKEMLDEFRAYSNGNIDYEFINPSENPDKKIRNEVYRDLIKQGLQPTNLEVKEGDANKEQIIFPGAIFSYAGQQIPVQLLKSQLGAGPEQMLNNSIQALEYEIANAIQRLTAKGNQVIAFTSGHGELDSTATADIRSELSEYYLVKTVKIEENLDALKPYQAIVIAKPTQAFSEKDKFIIDQFIMKGGKVLWLLESVSATMDSLTSSDQTMGVPATQNLEDQLFKYGVRINTNLIMDLQSAPIPVVTGYSGNRPQQKLFPWFFFPLFTSATKHPIVNNLNVVKGEFASTIDTVGRNDIAKIPLLQSSKYTRVVTAPARISLNLLREKPQPEMFSKPPQTAAILLEGRFPSVFKNRIPPEISQNKDIGYKEISEPNKMVIVSDGDIIKNYQMKNGAPYPLGFDRYTNTQYGNKNFILNVMNYLCDQSGLITVRSRELQLRLLDREKLQKERLKWQVVNTVLPVVIILIFGFIFNQIRKRRFAR